jgi:hypothetical protein
MTRIRVKQLTKNPLFGRPHLMLGQSFGIWGYSFQVGALLGAKYRSNMDPFGHAFIGASGPAGAVAEFLHEVVKPIVADSKLGSITFSDYVGQKLTQRAGYDGSWQAFIRERAMQKSSPEDAERGAWQFSVDGAAVGTTHPRLVSKMYELSHAPVDGKDWTLLRDAGLDIPPVQDSISYEDAVAVENGLFLEYCRECCPDLHSSLVHDELSSGESDEDRGQPAS